MRVLATGAGLKLSTMKTSSVILALSATLAAASCGTQHKLNHIRSGEIRAGLVLPESGMPRSLGASIEDAPRDTLRIVDFEGHETLIMNAIRDEDGEMVATDKLSAAMVTARFRNLAERHGKVDLEFQVFVPKDMQDSRWQLRLDPDLYALSDSLRLDPVIITGLEFRKVQLKGYEHYQRFLDSIITDSTRFINRSALEVFLERNIPELYAFRCDSSYVSEEQFASAFGVTEQEAVDHYTYKMMKRWNRRRADRAPLMYRKYVKAPIISEGIRLDTVLQSDTGDFIYNYVQTINTTPSLRKVEIVMSGGIWEQDKKVYTVPRSDALTFYISSFAGLADNTERYRTKIIERKVEANTACYIEFPQGRWDVEPTLGNNPGELGRIKANIRELLVHETFALDSISVEAYASPEGSMRSNEALSARRARAASAFFAGYAAGVKDSLIRERGVIMDIHGRRMKPADNLPDISIKGRSGGENWRMLNALVASDTRLTGKDKAEYNTVYESIEDLDERERRMGKLSTYKYMRESLYPRLRIVKFNFYLHRKGMVKDTIHTTELDSVYMRGVQYLRDHEYEKALPILRPYKDYNSALACLALDRNKTAMEILSAMPPSARIDYLKAIVYAREGDDRLAVQHYLHACAREPSFIHRGNLDPEISALIRKYDLRLDNS